MRNAVAVIQSNESPRRRAFHIATGAVVLTLLTTITMFAVKICLL